MHFHCNIIGGTSAAAEDAKICFAGVAALSVDDVAAVHQQVRTPVLRWFVRHGALDATDALDMTGWEHLGEPIAPPTVAPRTRSSRVKPRDRAGTRPG